MTKIQELLGLSVLSISASYLISKYVFKHQVSEKSLIIAAGVSFTSIIVYNYFKNKQSSINGIDGKQIALPDTYSSYGRLKDILSAQGYDLQIKK